MLVGHSERRHVFGETDEHDGEEVRRRRTKPGSIRMLCVGELLERARGGDTTQAVVLRQLRAGIGRPRAGAAGVDGHRLRAGVGDRHGRTATPEDATGVHAAIRRALRESIGAKADDVPILYGGSVNAENVASLLAAPEVDGLLVGGASLDADVLGGRSARLDRGCVSVA